MYIYEFKEWPHFIWDAQQLAEPLAAIRHRQGRLIGNMEALGFKFRQEAVLQTLTADVLNTSEIEGERLDAEQVRSSIARRLGMDLGALKPADRNVEGVVEMMLDATGQYDQPLTADRLFGWQAALFPAGRSGMTKINTTPFSKRASPIFGLSRSTRSTTEMAELRAPLQICCSRDPRIARSVFTACPRRSARSARSITRSLNRHREGRWTSHPGCHGF